MLPTNIQNSIFLTDSITFRPTLSHDTTPSTPTKDGTYTYHPSLGFTPTTHTSGYYVALHPTTIEEFIKLPFPSEYATNYDMRLFLGIWTDPETNIRHIDASQHYYDLHTAIRIATLAEQLAIYDISLRSTIPIPTKTNTNTP